MRIGVFSAVVGTLGVAADYFNPELFTPGQVWTGLGLIAFGLITRFVAGRPQYPHQDVLAGDTLLSKTGALTDRRDGGMEVPYSGDDARRRGRPK